MTMEKIRIGLIEESKSPPDTRVAIPPDQCRELMGKYPHIEVVAKSYSERCFTDEEYKTAGVKVQDDLENCDVIMGIKEVAIEKLIPNKTYLFFSHTIKEQPYNKELLQAIVAKNIRLIDYECLQWEDGPRILGFGRFAGIVGAHNGLYGWYQRIGLNGLKRAFQCKDYRELIATYRGITLPPIKIIVTGNGRVAHGAIEFLNDVGIRRVSKEDLLSKAFSEMVYTQLDMEDYYVHKSSGIFEEKDFFANPGNYRCDFSSFYKTADLMVNAIYWENRTPVFFSREDMHKDDFNIGLIADVTCDIMGSIPATLRATTIDDPIYGYDPVAGTETTPYQDSCIDIMAVDNLPNELPRSASEMFGKDLVDHIIGEFGNEDSNIIKKATITQNGRLTTDFAYLENYIS